MGIIKIDKIFIKALPSLILMSDILSQDALFVLNILYSNRCLTSSAGYHSEKLKKICRKKVTEDLDKVIKDLKNGYITEISKKEKKYYISDRKKAFFALKEAGYPVVEGRIRKL